LAAKALAVAQSACTAWTSAPGGVSSEVRTTVRKACVAKGSAAGTASTAGSVEVSTATACRPLVLVSATRVEPLMMA
jgi:hypothetical protein